MEDGKNRLNELRYRSKNRTEVEYAHICSIEKKDLKIFHRRLYIRFEMPQWTKRQQPDFQYISMAANRCIRLRHGLSMMICIQRIFSMCIKVGHLPIFFVVRIPKYCVIMGAHRCFHHQQPDFRRQG